RRPETPPPRRASTAPRPPAGRTGTAPPRRSESRVSAGIGSSRCGLFLSLAPRKEKTGSSQFSGPNSGHHPIVGKPGAHFYPPGEPALTPQPPLPTTGRGGAGNRPDPVSPLSQKLGEGESTTVPIRSRRARQAGRPKPTQRTT